MSNREIAGGHRPPLQSEVHSIFLGPSDFSREIRSSDLSIEMVFLRGTKDVSMGFEVAVDNTEKTVAFCRDLLRFNLTAKVMNETAGFGGLLKTLKAAGYPSIS